MKYTFKYIATLALGCSLSFTSCSDSWLETTSTQAADGETLFATTDNVKLAINGICRSMVQQHGAYGQMFNGEGTMKLLYGEYPGQDLFFSYMAPGWSPIMNNEALITQNESSIYTSYPWYYYYLIIGNANAVIARVDKAEGTQEEKDFLKAEALTFRAYSFFRLRRFIANLGFAVTKVLPKAWCSVQKKSAKPDKIRICRFLPWHKPTNKSMMT